MSVAALLAAPITRPHRPLPMQLRRTAFVSPCETYRWSLQRYWGDGQPGTGAILPWIMLNPSTADGTVDDPTLHRIICFSWRWGFDGLLVVNLLPFRSPKPADLREWLRWYERQDWSARDSIRENRSCVAKLLGPFDAAMAAWGSQAGMFGYEAELGAEHLLDAINDPDAKYQRASILKLFCLGETGGGHPTHPMARGRHRVPDSAAPRALGRYPGTTVGLGDEVVAA